MNLNPLFTPTKPNPGPCEGFNEHFGHRWIYPNNLPIRGFGKTFIAAVVMYNYHLWYPDGTILFVAPTRPLVAQQIQECKKISGIPSSVCVELTGTITREKRVTHWLNKLVFFATPQVIENDLENGILPAKRVRCVIIDEAHRAQGDYSYVKILRYLSENNRNGFRVVALSATPGSDIQRVQQVMKNLFINEVMFRSEHSIDLLQYKNEKCSKAWTVELVGKHKEYVDKFIQITKPIFQELYRAGLTYNGQQVDQVSKFVLIKSLETIKRNEIPRQGSSKSKLMYCCSAAITSSIAFESLTLYGMRVFYAKIKKALNEPRNYLKTLTAGNVEFTKMQKGMEEIFGADIDIDHTKPTTVDLTLSHPKLRVVKDLLLSHFDQKKDKTETRAIVFTKYRESVFDIVQSLRCFEPTIKAGLFVGQGDGGKAGTGMKQRDQIQLMSDFKEGKYNVIVATCVAEEGLDIGEVDLIICYDISASPISTVQRRGRTGRKRSGNIQTILTKGYEEKKLQKAGSSRRQVEEQLFKRDNYVAFRYREAPRMIPLHLNPVCFEHRVEPVNDTNSEDEKPKRRRKKVESEIEISSETKKKKTTTKKKLSEEEESDSDICSGKKKRKTTRKVKTIFAEDEDESDEDIFSTSKRQDDSLLDESKTIGSNSSTGFITSQALLTLSSASTTAPPSQQKDINSADSDIEWESDIEWDCIREPTVEDVGQARIV